MNGESDSDGEWNPEIARKAIKKRTHNAARNRKNRVGIRKKKKQTSKTKFSLIFHLQLLE